METLSLEILFVIRLERIDSVESDPETERIEDGIMEFQTPRRCGNVSIFESPSGFFDEFYPLFKLVDLQFGVAVIRFIRRREMCTDSLEKDIFVSGDFIEHLYQLLDADTLSCHPGIEFEMDSHFLTDPPEFANRIEIIDHKCNERKIHVFEIDWENISDQENRSFIHLSHLECLEITVNRDIVEFHISEDRRNLRDPMPIGIGFEDRENSRTRIEALKNSEIMENRLTTYRDRVERLKGRFEFLLK